MLKVSDNCYRCGDCIKACPVPGTITNKMAGKVRINSYSCIECKQCLPVCRFNLITYEVSGDTLEALPNLLEIAASLNKEEAKESFLEALETIPELKEKAKKKVSRKK